MVCAPPLPQAFVAWLCQFQSMRLSNCRRWHYASARWQNCRLSKLLPVWKRSGGLGVAGSHHFLFLDAWWLCRQASKKNIFIIRPKSDSQCLTLGWQACYAWPTFIKIVIVLKNRRKAGIVMMTAKLTITGLRARSFITAPIGAVAHGHPVPNFLRLER